MFSSILGNEAMKQTLLRLNAASRMPNAMLFVGPKGVGKKLFALEMARLLLCPAPVDGGEACGVCSACSRIGTFEIPPSDDNRDEFEKVFFGRHLDIGLVVPYKRFILVEAIRALEAESHFQPYEGKARVFIVDDADKMNANASNALLKTLEEPAPASHIVLVTSRPETLLPTIRSRCQTFRFAPVPNEEISEFLRANGTAAENASIAAWVSGGSVGAAISIDTADLVRRRNELLNVLRAAFVDGDRVRLLQAAEKLNEAKNKDFFENDLSLLLGLLRDVWAVSLGGTPALHTDITEQMAAIADQARPERFAAAMNELEMFRQGLAVNLNRKIATDDVFMKFAA